MPEMNVANYVGNKTSAESDAIFRSRKAQPCGADPAARDVALRTSPKAPNQTRPHVLHGA
jgi:hypothetical protein